METRKEWNRVLDYIVQKIVKNKTYGVPMFMYSNLNLNDSNLLKKYVGIRIRTWLKKFVKLGILSVFDDKYYRPSRDYKGGLLNEPKCKKYNINIPLFLEVCKQRGVDASEIYKDFQTTNGLIGDGANTDSLPQLYIGKYSTKESESLRGLSTVEILENICERYPQLLDYKEKVNHINKDHFQQLFANIGLKVNVDKTHKQFKIGVRATNAMCMLHSLKRHSDYPYYGSRESICDQKFGKGNWKELDVAASVPRLLHYKAWGEILPADFDCYKIMFSCLFDNWEEDDNGVNHNREFCKASFMKLLFTRKVSDAVNSFYHRSKKKGAKNKQYNENLKKFPEYFTEDGEPNREKLTALYEKMLFNLNFFCGQNTTKDTSVFADESFIYIDVADILLDRGLQFAQVYDAFFFRKDQIPEDFHEIVSKCTINYYDKYKNIEA